MLILWVIMMAEYKFKCKECSLTRTFSMSINKFLLKKREGGFKSIHCIACDMDSEFSQVFGTLSSTITRDREELVRDIQDEARAIANKVRSGDQKAIRNIYGED